MIGLRKILSNKRIAVGFAIILAIAVILIGGTIAYFSDTEVSVGNQFKAGKLNLKIDNTCHYNDRECICNDVDICFWEGTAEQCFCTWEATDLTDELFFSLLDVKPGDSGEDTISLHIDNNDAWLCAEIKNLKNYENDCDSPENKIDTTCGAEEGELKDNLFFTIWDDTNCNNILDNGEQVVLTDATAEAGIWPIADSTTGSPVPGGTTFCYGISWNVPLATSNIIQSDSILGDVIFSAIQARHMDDFECSDLISEEECVPTTEICGDGIDQDCDGVDLECPLTGECTTAVDCNDNNLCTIDYCNDEVCFYEAVNCNDGNGCTVDTCNPATGCSHVVPPEICGDGIDNDCDTLIDEEGAIGCQTYLPDADSDGYGQTGISACLCGPTGNYTVQGIGGDCNDSNALINPEAEEICTGGIDDDCDGAIDCSDSDCASSPACEQELTCAPLRPLFCGIPESGSTLDPGSTDKIDFYGGTCDAWPETGREYIYSFNPGNVNRNVSVALTNTTADLDIFVMDSQCTPSACKVSHNVTANFAAEAGKTYYFSIDGNSGAEGAYTITATCNPTCIPSPEACNGIDDDCDGQIDEDGVCGSCVWAPEICDGIDNNCDGQIDENCLCSSDAECNDGLYCNGVETCSPEGVCLPGNGDPCAGNLGDTDNDCSESCNETADNCTANDVVGSGCNDSIFCNGTDTCNASGSCANHSGDPCPGPDGDSDCSESCNETADNCTANDSDGTTCTDGTCQSGTCVPSGPLMLTFACTSSAQCDDGNPCTDDACTIGSCSHSANSRHDSCNDGDNCTAMDTCQTNGTCQGINVSWLYDTSSCTFESCNPAIGYNITKQPVGSACTDAYICTLGQGTCNNTGSCNSGGACLASTPTGCTVDAQCNDSNSCTNDSCFNNSCSHIALNCNDGNSLTTDVCIPETGCANIPCANYYYDFDGDGYGIGNLTCMNAPSGNYRATQAGDCNDGNGLINPAAAEICGNFIDDNCDGQIDEGVCYEIPVNPNTPQGGCVNNSECDDGNPLTIDSCINGSCVNYRPLIPTFFIPGVCTMDIQCDDSNATTVDQCNNGKCANYQPFTMPSFGVKFCFFGGCACWGNSCN